MRKGAIDIPFMIVMNIVWPMYGIMAVQPMMDFIVAIICLAIYLVVQKKDRRELELKKTS
ncbi:MAG: hypothetical protein LUE09_00105 [Synergistaceae bacterium]|nr:hypothetical protein [Synergistaceae bacterium]